MPPEMSQPGKCPERLLLAKENSPEEQRNSLPMLRNRSDSALRSEESPTS
jgi:hypothetical protein